MTAAGEIVSAVLAASSVSRDWPHLQPSAVCTQICSSVFVGTSGGGWRPVVSARGWPGAVDGAGVDKFYSQLVSTNLSL